MGCGEAHLRCNQVLDVTLKAQKVFVITLMRVGLVEGKESMKMANGWL